MTKMTNEKEIIVGKPSHTARMMVLFIGLGLIALGVLMYALNVGGSRIATSYDYYMRRDYTYSFSLFDLMVFDNASGTLVSILLDLGIVVAIVGVICYAAFAKVSITVTDKRVCGTANWGKRVDLPFDSISAVAVGALKGIAVATSSGTINFKGIENNIDVHKEISSLLIQRQDNKANIHQTTIKQELQQSNADELSKFKDLLDKGIITQEEFDAKKKQLLGL